MPSLGARLLGVLLYMIPWSDSLAFGNHLYIKYPFIQIIQIPAIPVILLERSIPFGNLLLFLMDSPINQKLCVPNGEFDIQKIKGKKEQNIQDQKAEFEVLIIFLKIPINGLNKATLF